MPKKKNTYDGFITEISFNTLKKKQTGGEKTKVKKLIIL